MPSAAAGWSRILGNPSTSAPTNDYTKNTTHCLKSQNRRTTRRCSLMHNCCVHHLVGRIWGRQAMHYHAERLRGHEAPQRLEAYSREATAALALRRASWRMNSV